MKLRTLLLSLAVLVAVVGLLATTSYFFTETRLHEQAKTMKAALVRGFHDPESAKFRNLRMTTDEGTIRERFDNIGNWLPKIRSLDDALNVFTYHATSLSLCGEVNAKNGFGAYAGYKAFYVSGSDDPHPFIDMSEADDFAKKMCAISNSVVYSEQ